MTLFRDKPPSRPLGEVPLRRPRPLAHADRRRTASSIQVPPGCRVTLFSEPNYQGRSTTFAGDNNELKNTPVGNDAAQSIRVECGQGRR